jgi:dihydrofolate reductase
MNSLPKYVFSKSLQAADWKNTTLLNGDAVDELNQLKTQPGKDLFIFGSADLSHTFIRSQLIDEYRLMVNPILIGSGVPLFKVNGEQVKLKLINMRSFLNGNVLLYYSANGNLPG